MDKMDRFWAEITENHREKLQNFLIESYDLRRSLKAVSQPNDRSQMECKILESRYICLADQLGRFVSSVLER